MGLSERTETPLDDLAALPVPLLCRRIAQAQYAAARDEARHVYHTTDAKQRRADLARLTRSALVTDRIAAALVARWDAAERAAR